MQNFILKIALLNFIATRFIEVLGTSQFVLEDGLVASPVARLAHIDHLTGKTSVMSAIVCMRLGELCTLLKYLDITNINTQAFSVVSKEVSNAIAYLHSSNLVSRLDFSTMSSSFAKSSIPVDQAVMIQVQHHSLLEAIEQGENNVVSIEDIEELLAPIHSNIEEDTQGGHDLANLQWLITAARAALKAVYEEPDISRGVSKVHDLYHLRDKLETKRFEIMSSLVDMKKLELCKEICANFHSQLKLLEEEMAAREKERSGVAVDSRNYQAAIANTVVNQLKLESNLRGLCAENRKVYRSVQSDLASSRITSSSEDNTDRNDLFDSTEPSPSRLSSRLAQLSPSYNSPSKLKVNQQQQNRFPSHAKGKSIQNNGITSNSVGSPNPLWVVMQSVFSNSDRQR